MTIENDCVEIAKCWLCDWWTGSPQNWYWATHKYNPETDLICAVSIPRPTEKELARVDGCVSYCTHNCSHYESNKLHLPTRSQ
jgi:hypothetical protein